MTKQLICCLLLAGVLSFNTFAQSKDEIAVTNAVESLRKAMIDADKPALEKLTAADLSYGHSGGKIEDKATFVDNIVTGKSDFVTIDLADQTVKVSGNTAIVRHKLTADTNDSGKPGNVKLYILLVWQKQKGDWKLLARQAVKVPQ